MTKLEYAVINWLETEEMKLILCDTCKHIDWNDSDECVNAGEPGCQQEILFGYTREIAELIRTAPFVQKYPSIVAAFGEEL